MRAALLSVLLVVSLACAQSLYQAPNCTVGEYDLLPLQYDPSGTPPTGYSFSNTTTADIISINFCAQVAASTQCTASTSTNPQVNSPGACQSFAGNPPTGAPQVLGDATTGTLAALTKGYTYGLFLFLYIYFFWQF